jgi:hypothetical protein
MTSNAKCFVVAPALFFAVIVSTCLPTAIATAVPSPFIVHGAACSVWTNFPPSRLKVTSVASETSTRIVRPGFQGIEPESCARSFFVVRS